MPKRNDEIKKIPDKKVNQVDEYILNDLLGYSYNLTKQVGAHMEQLEQVYIKKLRREQQ